MGTQAAVSELLAGVVNSLSGKRLPSLFDEPEEATGTNPRKSPSFDLGVWAKQQTERLAKRLFD